MGFTVLGSLCFSGLLGFTALDRPWAMKSESDFFGHSWNKEWHLTGVSYFRAPSLRAKLSEVQSRPSSPTVRGKGEMVIESMGSGMGFF
ncbi:hypothetical protein BV22DRAFT_1032719, partial [Leucogyrophana mollusca]